MIPKAKLMKIIIAKTIALHFLLILQAITHAQRPWIQKQFSIFVFLWICLLIIPGSAYGQKLQLNDPEYFETRGVNVLVYSNQYNGMFFDEKTARSAAFIYSLTFFFSPKNRT